MVNLWGDCLNCKNKCCELKISFPLFTTSEELSKIKEYGFNEDFSEFHSCMCYNKEYKKCMIYKIRPVDCRLFPFDVHIVDGKSYWIIWDLPCLIVDTINNKAGNEEDYLNFFENNIIPKFKQYLGVYNSFRCPELIDNYKFKILREIKF